jgi:hypothetical protein
MIGGIVTETKQLPDRIWLDCEEQNSTSKCAIYVERNENSERIKAGDSVWWQGGYALWTPYGVNRPARAGKDYDIRIPRIGFSGVSKP